MKCCNNSQDDGNKQNSKHKGPMSHMWMMALCCGAPIILLFLIPLISAGIPGSKGVLSKLIPFICPVMMVIMIPMMFRKKKGNETEDHHCDMKQEENKRLE